jgi:hypothetical protein
MGDARAQAIDDTPAGGTDSQRPLDYGDTVVLESNNNGNRVAAPTGTNSVIYFKETRATGGVAMQNIVTGAEPVLADGKSDATIVQKATERAENSVEGGSVSESPSKKCYWKIAEEELKEKNPNAYNDLQNLQAFNKRAAFPVGNSDSPVAHDGEAILMKSRSIADETLEVATELWDKVEVSGKGILLSRCVSKCCKGSEDV